MELDTRLFVLQNLQLNYVQMKGNLYVFIHHADTYHSEVKDTFINTLKSYAIMKFYTYIKVSLHFNCYI